ncbi:hypothetical protein PTMSG1_01542 [Pyrenophora teres f. maculata]|nr:hypothetical protein PTMSG1_01542 [Pyrenophora teres f. maculata]
MSSPPTPAASATPEATGATEPPQGPLHRSGDAYVQLPYHRVMWQDQSEIELAQPLAMKYGRVIERRADVWIYLTKTIRTLIFHSYHPDGEPDGVHIVDEILEKAIPCFAFKLAKTPMEILALATYYFMRKGLPENYNLALTPHQADLLSAMCRGKRRSKVVVLKVCLAPGQTPKSTQEPETPQPVQALEVSPSRDTSQTQPEEVALLAGVNEELQQPVKVESTPTSPFVDPPIDRYLDLEDEEKELSDELKRYNCRVTEMRRRVIEAQALLEKEEKEAAKVVDRKDKSEAEKKRLWDAMSKEDVRELGRRGGHRKRQKAY